MREVRSECCHTQTHLVSGYAWQPLAPLWVATQHTTHQINMAPCHPTHSRIAILFLAVINTRESRFGVQCVRQGNMQITAPCQLVAKVAMAIQHIDLTWCQPHHAAEHVSSGALARLSRLPLVCALDQLIHPARWFQVVRWQLRHVQKVCVCVWEGAWRFT
jgi:hypothetical protein